MFSLEGKTALITGSSRGIGQQIALILASQGANIHLHSTSAQSASPEATIKQIESYGRKVDIIHADLANKSVGREIAEGVHKSSVGDGKIDIVVLNGAVAWNQPLEKIDETNIDEHYSRQMDINVRSNILIVNALLPHLNQGARIVLIGSASGRGGYPGQTVYGGSKAFLEHLARTWSKELGQKYKLTVNCVIPGPVSTEMFDSIGDDLKNQINAMVKSTPADARMGTTKDVADIVAFLCSEESRWVTGSTICANGVYSLPRLSSVFVSSTLSVACQLF